MRRKLSFVAMCIALSATSTTVPSLASDQSDRPDNDNLPRYFNVAPGIFRGGQPSTKGLAMLKDSGIKTVISLRNNRGLTSQEEKSAKDLGMSFVSIPLDGISKPSKETIEKFLAVVENPEAQPVFVHCQEGVDRTGTMIAIYRQEAQKWTAADAYKEMVKKGFHKSYVWLADAVFDYGERKGLASTSKRPLNVVLYDSFTHMFAFVKT